jgi:hypothetical protein
MTRLSLWAMLATTASAAAAAPVFLFAPVPRWSEPPETEEVCAAIEKECPTLWAAETIETEFGYEELYDPEGILVGVQMTRSTGCKPLDESLLLGQRRFRLAFHAEGKPDIDDIHAELGAGVSPDQVRIVKASQTSVSMGCR